MRLRLVGLFFIAVACAWLAAAVAKAGTEETTVVVARPAAVVHSRSALVCPIPKRFRPAFERAKRDTGLPLALLTAVARVESNLRHKARSHAAPSNVLAGARYLRLMLERFHSTDLALAAYNAGPTAVAKAGGAPSAEVLTYVANVSRLWRRLQGCR